MAEEIGYDIAKISEETLGLMYMAYCRGRQDEARGRELRESALEAIGLKNEHASALQEAEEDNQIKGKYVDVYV